MACLYALVVAGVGLQALVYWPWQGHLPRVVDGRAHMQFDEGHRLVGGDGRDAVVFECPRGATLGRYAVLRALRFDLFKQSFPCGSAGWLSGALGNERVQASYNSVWRPLGPKARLLSLSHEGRELFGPGQVRRHILHTFGFIAATLTVVLALALLGLEWLVRNERKRRARLVTGRI